MADIFEREKVPYVKLTAQTPIKDQNKYVDNFNNPNTPQRVSGVCSVSRVMSNDENKVFYDEDQMFDDDDKYVQEAETNSSDKGLTIEMDSTAKSKFAHS